MKRTVFAAIMAVAAAQTPIAAEAQSPTPEVVTIELSNFKFAPSELTLQHGRAYRLHIVNAAGGGHDFTAPEFFAASAILPVDRAAVADGKVRLPGKASADVTLTPERAGTYELRCSHFLHAGMGMKGRIVVQ